VTWANVQHWLFVVFHISATQFDQKLTAGDGLIWIQFLNLLLDDVAQLSEFFFVVLPSQF
jgi:hypothetical protein